MKYPKIKPLIIEMENTFIGSELFGKLWLFVTLYIIFNLWICAIFNNFIFAFKNDILDNRYMLLSISYSNYIFSCSFILSFNIYTHIINATFFKNCVFGEIKSKLDMSVHYLLTETILTCLMCCLNGHQIYVSLQWVQHNYKYLLILPLK